MPINFDNELYEYCLHVFGPMFNDERVVAQGLTASKHYFTNISELWYFLAELKITEHHLKCMPLLYEIKEGKDVRYCTVVTLTFFYDYVVYETTHQTDFIKEHGFLMEIFAPKNSKGACDCFRSELIRKTVPSFPKLNHGYTIELLKIKFEDKKM